jgi:hypothetical protein
MMMMIVTGTVGQELSERSVTELEIDEVLTSFRARRDRFLDRSG